MYKSYDEIFKQDEVLKRTFEYISTINEEIKAFIKNSDFDQIVYIGCGSSYWSSLSASMSCEKRSGIKSFAVSSGDVLFDCEYYKNAYSKPLFVAPSRSGNTSETLIALELLTKHYGSDVISIVEYPDSPLKKVSGICIETPWANEISVCQTRSFSNLYLAEILIGALIGKDDAFIAEIGSFINTFDDKLVDIEAKLVNLIKDFKECSSLVSLGSGCTYGVAIEGAYIVIEMTQLHSNYYPVMELRHGPIVMLDGKWLVAVFSNGSRRDLEENMAKDSRNKGARVLSISKHDDFINADYRFSIGESVSDEVLALYGIAVMQGFAHLKAVDNGIDPDSPKDLIPWIKI